MDTEKQGDPAVGPPAETAQPPALGEIGAHVSAILQSAQQAADDIRKQATDEAERIKQTAEQEAAAKSEAGERRLEEQRRQIEQLRPDADAYRDEVRKTADAYADDKRREAEEHARRVRDEAQADARKTEEDAVRRRKALQDESRALQTWLDQAVTAFKEVTGRLEALADSRPQQPEAPPPKQEESLEEAVHPRGDYAKTQ